MDALDADPMATPGTYISRAGEIVVSLTDSLLMMRDLQRTVAPLPGADVSSQHLVTGLSATSSEISGLASGLRKQRTAFAFQLALLSWSGDCQNSLHCIPG